MGDRFEGLVDYLQEWRSLDEIMNKFSMSRVVSNRQIKKIKQFFYVERKKFVREQSRGRPSVLYKICKRD